MTARVWLWLVPGLLYAAFCFWYTNTGGPLSDEEIDAFVAQMQQNGRDPGQIASLRQFMENDTGRQVLMVNILDMADTPRRVEGVSPDETTGQVMGRYMEHMYPALFSRASHPAFMGNAVFNSMDIVGIEGC